MSDFVGKTLLAGTTVLGSDGAGVNRFQVFGTISSVEPQGVTFERAGGEGPFTLPPDTARLQLAAAGEYRLSGSGRTISNPDLLCICTVHQP